jgi:hypothetical protein
MLWIVHFSPSDSRSRRAATARIMQLCGHLCHNSMNQI